MRHYFKRQRKACLAILGAALVGGAAFVAAHKVGAGWTYSASICAAACSAINHSPDYDERTGYCMCVD